MIHRCPLCHEQLNGNIGTVSFNDITLCVTCWNTNKGDIKYIMSKIIINNEICDWNDERML
jgi:hypothetical protein